MTTTIAIALLWLGSEPVTAQSLSEETRAKVQTAVRGYLSTLCPTQCELAEVQVKVAPRKPPPGTTPGFEELSPDIKDYVVQSVDVGVMIDKRLPGEFRTSLKTLIERRLKAEGIPATVKESVLKMPLPQDLPDNSKPPQMPSAASMTPPDKPDKGALSLEDPRAQSPWARFLDALPLLLGLLLCAVVVGYTLRQYARLLDRRVGAAGEAEKDKDKKLGGAGALAAAAAKTDQVRIEKDLAALGERIGASPALRRELFREWLREDNHDSLATAVAVLGAGVLADVRSDPECEDGLRGLDAYLAQHDPDLSPEAKVRLVGDLKRRLLRAEVRRGGDAASDALAFLASADEEAFAQALAAEDEPVQVALLRHAPERLQKAAFATRPASEQARLLRALVSPETCSRERLLDAAERVRAQVAGQAAGTTARQARAAAQLLETADAPERRRILAALASGEPAAYRRVMSELVTEETLAALPTEVLGAALLRLDVGQAALALQDLPGPTRMRLLASLPPQQARAIEDESEALQASGPRREAARRAAFAEVRRAALERRIDLYEINHRAWRDKRIDEEAIA